MTWQAANPRGQRLPPHWRRLRAAVLRDTPTCALCNAAPATDVDHIVPGDNHDRANLQALCRPCHATKSAAEGVAAQRRRSRPPEPHPGTIT